MKYYLETNSLYSINKIDKKNIKDYFTSVFAISELISGITEEKFEKRRNILNHVKNSTILIDWQMPEEIIFNSFNVLKSYDYNEERVVYLQKLYDKIVLSENFIEFESSHEYKKQKYNFEYFKQQDIAWSKGFIGSTVNGNKNLKTKIEKSNIDNTNTFNFNGKDYEISKLKEFETFFEKEILFNESITILSLSEMLRNKVNDGLKTNEIYDSYNGLITFFVKGFSIFCFDKIVAHETPATNDFTDLKHLLYLKNDGSRKIVSDDKLFSKILKEQTETLKKINKC